MISTKIEGASASGMRISHDFLSPSRPSSEKTSPTGEKKKKKKATHAAPLLAGKPLQRRSTPRRGRELSPSAVSRGQGRPTSSLARALAAEEKVIAAEIDASTLVPSTSSAPERLIPEVADLEDILAERDACGVSLCLYAVESNWNQLVLASERQTTREANRERETESQIPASESGGLSSRERTTGNLSHPVCPLFPFSVLSPSLPPRSTQNRSASSPTSSCQPRTPSSPRPSRPWDAWSTAAPARPTTSLATGRA